jgi:hypothetical protein
MTFKRAVVAAAIALAVAPASASAQVPITPPEGDAYLRAVLVNSEIAPLKLNDPLAFTADTSTYTTQADLFNPRADGTPGSGGPKEPNKCGNAVYGKTIWSAFYTHRYGRVTITASGPSDWVIGVVPFKNLDNAAPNIGAGLCYDSVAGFDERTTFLVSPKKWRAVQVGGTSPTGPSGGQVQVSFELKKPPTVGGQAFLFWKTGPLRVTDLHVKSVPKGQRISISCTKGSCSKKTISVKSKVVARRLGGDLGSGPFAQVRMRGASGTSEATSADTNMRAVVREAKAKVQVLKNQKVNAKSKIELRITRPGYIGKYYVWTVSKSSISASTLLCLNPGSGKPRKKCNG